MLIYEIQTVVFLLSGCKANGVCDHGWFGHECQYKCNCQEVCQENGYCPDAQCTLGWFGRTCQFQNLLTNSKGISVVEMHGKSTEELTDDRDATCANYSKTTLRIDSDLRLGFSIIRLVSPVASTLKLTVKLYDHALIESANHLQFVVDGGKMVELRFMGLVFVRVVFLEFDNDLFTLCSIYISLGRNLAINQKVSLKDSSDAKERMALVNGNTSQCQECCLALKKNEFINVTLHTEVTLHRIVLLAKDTAIFDGNEQVDFVISNKMNKVIGQMTVKPTSDQPTWLQLPEPVQTIAIRHQFQTVNYIEICELEIYGDCGEGYWDLDCVSACDVNCLNGCSSIDGTCTLLCRKGQLPPECSDCPMGTYGHHCANGCNNCYNATCHPVTGACKAACNGYTNFPNCTEKCPNGYYGKNCLLACGHCDNGSCSHLTGACTSGCVGYIDPPYCTTKILPGCTEGYYGHNCTLKCSSDCRSKTCDPITGYCSNTSCQDGKDCEKKNYTCDSCFESNCHPTTGLCLNGCYGFQDPPNCSRACKENFYGYNCQFQCSERCYQRKCHSKTGQCLIGCADYKNPPNCSEPCNNTHGLDCKCEATCSSCADVNLTCTKCLFGHSLNSKTGRCVEDLTETAMYALTNNLNILIPVIISGLFLAEVIVGFYYYFFRYKKKNMLDDEGEEE